jgi:hypothetical protein
LLERRSKWSDRPEDNNEKLKTISLPQSQLPLIMGNVQKQHIQINQINSDVDLNSIINTKTINQNLLLQLTENTKFQRKVYIPKLPGVNFVGLLIGPKGTYQKRLEAQTNCKILIRGK